MTLLQSWIFTFCGNFRICPENFVCIQMSKNVAVSRMGFIFINNLGNTRSNPRRLFSFHANAKVSHYHVWQANVNLSFLWIDGNGYRNEYTNGWKVWLIKFSQKNTLEMHVNDNNNFAPSLFRSLCETVGDCFGASEFFFGSCTPSEKYLGSKQSPPIYSITSKEMVSSYYCLMKSL